MALHASHLCSVARSGHDCFLLFGTVSYRLTGVQLICFGLCLWSQGRALLRSVWNGVRRLVCVQLCTVSGSSERVAWVDCYSSFAGGCVHGNFLSFSSSCVSLSSGVLLAFPSCWFSLT